MPSSYPGALDPLPNDFGDNTPSFDFHVDDLHKAERDAIRAIQAELGTDPSGSSATVKDRLDALEALAARKVFPVTYDLFGPVTPAADAFHGDTSVTTYTSSTAYSATAMQLFGSPAAELVYALMEVIWTPKAIGSGVQINKADAGPTNVVQIAEFTNDATATPVVAATDIKSAIQTILDDPNYVTNGKYIAWKYKTGGVQSPDIFAIRLKLGWKA